MEAPGEFRRSGNGGDFTFTDARGRFEFAPKLEAFSILATHDEGFAEMKVDDVLAGGKVQLQPWGRLKGVVRVGTSAAAEMSVVLQNMHYRFENEGRNSPALSLYMNAELDGEGRFDFAKVPPGERKVFLRYRFRENEEGPIPMSHGVPIVVKPSETTEVVLGGEGRPVIGRIRVIGGEPSDVDWRRDVHTLYLKLPDEAQIPPPDMSGATTAEAQQKRWAEYNARQRAFWATEKGRALDRAHRSYALLFETNAAFRIENVPAGAYFLSVTPTDPERERYNYQQLGSLHKEVVIPEAPPGRADEPFDLGTLDLQIKSKLRLGQAAPDFSTRTFDGKPVKLADYRGQHVLLYFWATWAGSSSSELDTLKSVHDTYRAGGKFTILGLNLDNEAKAGEDFATASGFKWTQCYLGQWGETQVPARYGIEGIPAAVLIDPDGKLIRRNIRGASIRTAVRDALSGERKPAQN
jgi:peroxiredoxin